METFNPGYCTVESATLTSYAKALENITALITGCAIRQSMDSSQVTVDLQILDSIGLLHNFPIRGEETLSLHLKSHDNQTEVRIPLQVFAVSDVATKNEKMVYTLSCVTTTSYEAATKEVITAFRDHTASYAAKKIFEKNYGKGKVGLTSVEGFNKGTVYQFSSPKKTSEPRYFIIEKTDALMRMTIPSYTPSQAMNFLCAKAYSADNFSSTYRFFETLDGYSWVTDEWLLLYAKESGKTKNLFYAPGDTIPRDPREGNTIIESLEMLDHAQHVNTASDMQGGGYVNTVMELDLVNHTKKEYTYVYGKKKYALMGGTKSLAPLGDKHSPEFVKNTFNKSNGPQRVIVRDWAPDGFNVPTGSTVRPNQYMKEIISNRIAYNYHLMNSKVTAGIKGRLDIKPGEVINLSLIEPDITMSSEQNKRLKGRWLVYSTDHKIEMSQLKTTIELVKYDWDSGLES